MKRRPAGSRRRRPASSERAPPARSPRRTPADSSPTCRLRTRHLIPSEARPIRWPPPVIPRFARMITPLLRSAINLSSPTDPADSTHRPATASPGQEEHDPDPIQRIERRQIEEHHLRHREPRDREPGHRNGLIDRRNPTRMSAAANTSHHALTASPAASSAVTFDSDSSSKYRRISPVTPNSTSRTRDRPEARPHQLRLAFFLSGPEESGGQRQRGGGHAPERQRPRSRRTRRPRRCAARAHRRTGTCAAAAHVSTPYQRPSVRSSW